MKNKKFTSALAIAFYVFAIIMLGFAVYFLASSISYLNQYAASYGTTVSQMGKDAVQYVINAVLPYLIYAGAMFGIAKIIARLDALKAALAGEEAPVEEVAAAAAYVVETAEEAVEEVAEETEETATEEATEEVAEEATEEAEKEEEKDAE